jgi:hypothetical protein
VRGMWGGGGGRCMRGMSVVCRALCDDSFLCAGNPVVPSQSADIFNAITGNWSTAVLSEARLTLVATSLPNQGLAIFAGGQSKSCYCDDCRKACGVELGGMHAWEECGV